MRQHILTKDKNFKMIFGSYENISILTSFLSDYLEVSYESLDGNIEFLKQELDEKNNLLRQSVDVLVKLPTGVTIQIEMNAQHKSWLKRRNFLYAIRGYEMEFEKTKKYDQENKYIQINFNSFSDTILKDRKVYKMRTEEGEILVHDMEIHMIDIPYCKDRWYNGDRRKLSRWASILACENEEELRQIIGDDLMNEDAKKKLEKTVTIIKKGDPGWWDYELDNLRIENSIKSEARKEGLKEGREEGIKEGIKEGQKKEQIRIIKKLKCMGMDIKDMKELVDLSESEIKKI